jgi:hypothetical protein
MNDAPPYPAYIPKTLDRSVMQGKTIPLFYYHQRIRHEG